MQDNSSEELYNLDNDSFLNSLEAISFPDTWPEAKLWAFSLTRILGGVQLMSSESLSSDEFLHENLRTFVSFKIISCVSELSQRLLPQLPRGDQLPRHVARGKAVSFSPLKHWLNLPGGLKVSSTPSRQSVSQTHGQRQNSELSPSLDPWRCSAPLELWLNLLGGLKSELLGASEKVQTSKSWNLNRGVNFLGDSKKLFPFLELGQKCDLLGLSAKLWALMSSGSLSSDEQLSASTCLWTIASFNFPGKNGRLRVSDLSGSCHHFHSDKKTTHIKVKW